jgi:hypothetical protein
MPASRQCQRAVQLGRDLSRPLQQTALIQQFDEAARGIHGSHGVGARRAYANFEYIENA